MKRHDARASERHGERAFGWARRTSLAYVAAIGVPLLWSLSKSFWPRLGEHPFVLFLPCVTIVAALGGAAPAGIATLLSALVIDYAFLAPIGRLSFENPVAVLLFVAEGCVLALVFEAFHRTRDRLVRALAELRVAHGELEESSRVELDAKDAHRRQVESKLLSTEAQLRQAQKMEAVGRLAGGVAHDFNNVLSIILSYVELALDDLPKDAPLRADLEEVKSAAQRAAAITKQLLAFSRQQVAEQKVVDVNQLIEESIRMVSRFLGEDVELVPRLANDLGRIKCDPEELSQVLMNLFVNARDAMPTGGTITVETENVDLDDVHAAHHLGVRAGPHVMIAVTDTGVGMDRETQQRIFEPFFTTKEKGKGTGLGLSTVYGIVRRCGGTVWVYSEPGHGTTFKIYLPQTDEQATRSIRAPALPARGGSETILVVEDEPQLRALTRTILQRGGYDVLESANGVEALEIAERHPGAIDLVLTDVVMPKMGGRELGEKLVSTRPTTKLLYVSGYTDDDVTTRGLTEVGAAFLQKPITPEGLLRKVREVLDARELRG